MARNINVSSLNVRGLNNVAKRNTIYTWIKENKFDIILLQETYFTKTNIAQCNKEWKGDSFHSLSESSHSRGVSILLNKTLNYKILSSHSDKNGRIILINLELNNNEYTLVNIYAPNAVKDRIVFFQTLTNFINQHALNKSKMFIGGDFNCVLTASDRYSCTTDKSMNALKDVMDKYKLIDIWKMFNSTSNEFTYINPTNSTRNSRIDFILCSPYIKTCSVSCKISQSPAPDHKAVCLVVELSSNARGKGYWKFNNTMLKEKDFEDGVKNLFTALVNEYAEHVPKGLLWDYIKVKLKEFCINYGINKAKCNKDKYNLLQNSLDLIDKQLSKNYNEFLCQERKLIKAELDEYYKKQSQGYQIRSRAKWVEEGEQSTRYFLNLEKVRQNYNCINSLNDCHGTTVTTDHEILQVAKVYYSNLFKSKNISLSSIHSYFDKIVPENVLTEEAREMCEGAITNNECLTAITLMKKNKSPGLDGFTVEFYEYFWPLLGNLLVGVFNECFENGLLTESQRCSVLSLIFKRGDVENIENYRPISLTNLDYRILSFVLSNRLQQVIDPLVSHDQTAYIKNRYMGYNIRLISDIIDHFDKFQIEGILFMTDFKKAFDSLDRSFMLKTLDFFNFGPSFKRWIEILYTDIVGKIKNNGYFSEEFPVTRGVKQGCPVSALLFILAIEILGLRIRQNQELKGFNLGFPNNVVKTIQYADDCVFCVHDENELCTFLTIIEEFGKVSGLDLNLSKCEGLWLGKAKNRQVNCQTCGIRWPDQLRYLGIYIGHSQSANTNKNWLEKIDKVTEILDKWKQRDLSLFGKVQILKTFAISQFVLPASLLTVSPEIIKKIECILFTFLWGSRDKVKRTRVIQEVKHGGLGMIDICTLFMSFKAVWISRLLKCNPYVHSWSQIPYVYYEPFLMCNTRLVFNFDDKIYFPELEHLNTFYKEVFLCFNKAFCSDGDTFRNKISNQCLWANKHIYVRRKNGKCCLFLRNWIRSGVNLISDLEFVNGKLDVNFLLRKIRCKSNIIAEISILQRALQPYQDILRFLTKQPYQHIDLPTKSKFFYVNLFKQIPNITLSCPKYLAGYCSDDKLVHVFTTKVTLEKEIKFKEFNFKLLHGILACNVNLKKWHIKDNSDCDVCGLAQTIEHLLFDCIYVKPLWSLVDQICNINTTFRTIIGLDNACKENCIVTLISFIIYKEWLLLSLQNKCRNRNIVLSFYKSELLTRLRIYEKCKRFDSKFKIRMCELTSNM